MNLRQKYKKAKAELEHRKKFIAKQKYTVTQFPVHTLCAQIALSSDDYQYLKDNIGNMLIRHMSKELEKNLYIKTRNCDYPNQIIVEGRIDVAKPYYSGK